MTLDLSGEGRSGGPSRDPIGEEREVRAEREGSTNEGETSRRRRGRPGENLIKVLALGELIQGLSVPVSVARNTPTHAVRGLLRKSADARKSPPPRFSAPPRKSAGVDWGEKIYNHSRGRG